MNTNNIDDSLLQLKRGTSSDTSIKTLLRYYTNENILNLRPSYQRNEVINRTKASGIIESAVLGIPIPPIYLFKDEEGKLEVIDGQQRLISFFGFLGKLSEVKTKLNGFKLIGLDILKNLNGLNYNDEHFKLVLNDKILDFTLKTFTFEEEKGFERSLKYEIFERLNKNPYPIKANSFELWNCIYLSNFTRCIKEIVKTDIFKESITRKSETKNLRMDNENDVLRFMTLIKRYDSLKKKNSVQKYLMLQQVKEHFNNKISKEDSKVIEKSFLDILKKIKLIFGSNIALSQLVNENRKSKNPRPNYTLLDIIILSFKDEDIKFLQKYRDEILTMFKKFFSDETNCAMIQNSRKGEKKIVNSFIDRVNNLKTHTLDEIRKKYNIEKTERTSIRTIFLEEKLLKKQEGLCSYCKNQIKPTDEYEIDHLQPIADFGNNDEENLALLHKECNREKATKRILIK